MCSATLNQVLTLMWRLSQKEEKPLDKFGPNGPDPAA
jgi:hypothetical protein